jgi:Glycosyl transferase family 2
VASSWATWQVPAKARAASSEQRVNDARPPLSVVVGTTQGWPYVRRLVEALRPDAESLDLELIFVDASGRPAPAMTETGPNIRWLPSNDDSVFRLYAEGLRVARGDVVATTEDHALPHPGWCAAILAAHRDHPEAAAVGGAIENGSPGSLTNWASYFITQGPHMAPLGDRPVPVTTNEANVSYKRWAVENLDDNDGLGFMAILHNRRLVEAGAVLRVDDRIVVDHFETVGIRNTSVIHFHNGRSISGFERRRGMTSEQWLRMGAALLLPLWRTSRAVRSGLAKGRMRRQLLASAPIALWLDYCGGVGHLVGYVAGAGDSPRHLR